MNIILILTNAIDKKKSGLYNYAINLVRKNNIFSFYIIRYNLSNLKYHAVMFRTENWSRSPPNWSCGGLQTSNNYTRKENAL